MSVVSSCLLSFYVRPVSICPATATSATAISLSAVSHPMHCAWIDQGEAGAQRQPAPFSSGAARQVSLIVFLGSHEYLVSHRLYFSFFVCPFAIPLPGICLIVARFNDLLGLVLLGLVPLAIVTLLLAFASGSCLLLSSPTPSWKPMPIMGDIVDVLMPPCIAVCRLDALGMETDMPNCGPLPCANLYSARANMRRRESASACRPLGISRVCSPYDS